MVYLSEIKGKAIFDENEKKTGTLQDLVFEDGETYAEVTHLIYLDEKKYRKKIPWDLVKELKNESKGKKAKIKVILNVSNDNINPFFEKEKETLISNIVDKQLIDVDGFKVVRVNDVLLGKINDKFCVVAVAIGTRSFMRRFGVENIMPGKVKEKVIKWESVERLEQEFHDLHLITQKSKIADLHPEDIADLMEDLSHEERFLIFNSLDKKKAAETLIDAEKGVQKSLFSNLKIRRIVDLLENIPHDQSADILSLMSKSKVEKILNSMRSETTSKIKEILGYNPESAGAIMDTEFITVPENYNVRQTINYLRKIKPPHKKIFHLYVVNNKKQLKGVISIRELITSQPNRSIIDFTKKGVIYVKINTPKEDIAKAVSRYDLFVLPVVDENKVIKGIVTADDVLAEVMPENWKKSRYKPHKIKRKK